MFVGIEKSPIEWGKTGTQHTHTHIWKLRTMTILVKLFFFLPSICLNECPEILNETFVCYGILPLLLFFAAAFEGVFHQVFGISDSLPCSKASAGIPEMLLSVARK